MKTISRYIMTLVALLALTTQAWATDVYVVGNGNGEDNWLNGVAWAPDAPANKMTEQNGVYSITFTNVGANSDLEFKFAINGSWNENIGCISTTENKLNKTLSNIEADGFNIMFVLTEAADVTISFNLSELTYMISTNGMKVGDDTPVEWDAATKTGTFAMPASDVVLTPIYSAATISHAAGTPDASETAFETLKEAFANVQDGDVIKLDWNVTLTETLETPSEGEGMEFTIDFNGYTINGDYGFNLKNAGDHLTFIDSSDDKLGGFKGNGLDCATGSQIVFESGRYNIGQNNAKTLNAFCAIAEIPWTLAPGKEFVDIENAPDANGFYVSVDWKTYELAIGSQKFVTFYSEYNVKLDEATDGVNVYTVSGIDTDRSLAYVSPVSGVVAKETPILLYNATDNQLTAKLTVTPDDANAVDVAPEFKGTAEAREFTADDMAAADYYVLSGGKAFAPVRGTGTIAKNKCWLQFDHETNGSAPARQLTIVFDNGDATGVNEVIEVNEVSDDTLYDLNGRKLNGEPTRKGVYIQNGQKVVK